MILTKKKNTSAAPTCLRKSCQLCIQRDVAVNTVSFGSAPTWAASELLPRKCRRRVDGWVLRVRARSGTCRRCCTYPAGLSARPEQKFNIALSEKQKSGLKLCIFWQDFRRELSGSTSRGYDDGLAGREGAGSVEHGLYCAHLRAVLVGGSCLQRQLDHPSKAFYSSNAGSVFFTRHAKAAVTRMV